MGHTVSNGVEVEADEGKVTPLNREITEHRTNVFNREHVAVFADPPSNGGASHLYNVQLRTENTGFSAALIKFQQGPVKEVGVNGLSEEALIAIIIDRLRGWQKGPYSCRENACALTHFEEGLMWLHKRTLNREARGVEGTSTV